MSTSFESPAGTIEVLDIVPRQGPGGMNAQSRHAAISVAADEINRSAGIPGREIRTTNIDEGGRRPRYRARWSGRPDRWKCPRYSAPSTSRGLETVCGVRCFRGDQPIQRGYIARADRVGFEIVDRTSGRRMRTLENYTPTSESSTERNRPRPSSLGPVSGSVACSGCGIKPTTRPFAEAMPAMPRCEPFGLPLA
jgi:hypothetical protein